MRPLLQQFVIEGLDVGLQSVESIGLFKRLLIHVQAFVHLNHHRMVSDWHLKCLAVGEWRVDAHFVATRQEMLLNFANDNFLRASGIVIEADADVNIRWIAAQQIGLT